MSAAPMETNGDELLDEYVLSTQLLTDGEPIRCVATAVVGSAAASPPSSSSSSSSSLEILSGSEGGVVSRIVLPPSGGAKNADGSDADAPLLEIQPGGAATRHPHQITAILHSSLIPGGAASAAGGFYVTGCKDGNVRVMNGKTHEVMHVLEGHSKAVTSLSWILPREGDDGAAWLVSGSWDGTARLWSLSPASCACLGTLAGHENTVGVAGLPAESGGVRRAVTVSAGAAEGNAIRGHAVRIWRLTPSADGSLVGSEMTSRVADDHSGPIRDVAYDPETASIYTCSNDGTVKIRSADDGSCTTTLAYPGGDRPMLLSLCMVGDRRTKAVVAGAEDGSVAVWDLSRGGEARVIAHPGCVWRVAALRNNPGSGSDFLTACNDGHLRVFTRDPSRPALPSVLASFEQSVTESRAVRSSGPSAEEIAKLPLWEMNSLTQGRSEGQVQVFNKGGGAIAAQWSAASGTWIEVGEVTGTNANAGAIDGERYDHVLPIEIDVAGGGVQTLKIGYNNGENPFVTAQGFIDENMLDQGYLAQIADYIRERTGGGGTTLGAGGGGPAPAPSSAPVPMDATPTYDHLPMKGYKIFNAGADKKGLKKVIAKIREFNGAVPSADALSSNEAGEVLDSLSYTLATTNRYHSSTVSDDELAVIRKMITGWDAKHVFPALDLARMAVLHPDASSGRRGAYWEEVLGAALDGCAGMGDGVAREVAVPMLTMRLVANGYKGGAGSSGAAGSLTDRILECARACAPSENKNVRLSVATAVLNASSFLHASPAPASLASATRVLDAVGAALSGDRGPEPTARALAALGTALLLPGAGAEVRAAARARGMGAAAERAAGGGDGAAAVAREVLSVLRS